uniref:Uncharacterized protein n=1 Tax=Phlebotomus papatasi TaxID=29031 RepID=A0A3F2ZEK3_PHLPP
MLSIFETLGWLSRAQIWMTIFDYDLQRMSWTKRLIIGFLRRLPIFVISGISCFELFFIFYGKVPIPDNESVTSETVTLIDITTIKIASLFLTAYFALMQKSHLQLINEGINLEAKWTQFFGEKVFQRRIRLRRRYNIEFLLLILYNFTYNYVFYLNWDYQQVKSLDLIWYIALSFQTANVDFTAFYMVGFINVFVVSLVKCYPEKLTPEQEILFLKFLTDYFKVLKMMNFVFGIVLIGVLVVRLIEASTTSYFLFIITYDIPYDYMGSMFLFMVCCFLWTSGNIFVMLKITTVGDYFQEKVVNIFNRLASSLEIYEHNNRTLSNCVSFNTKTVLLKNRHEYDLLKIGRFSKINRKLLFSILAILASNITIFIQFRQFEFSIAMEGTEE